MHLHYQGVKMCYLPQYNFFSGSPVLVKTVESGDLYWVTDKKAPQPAALLFGAQF